MLLFAKRLLEKYRRYRRRRAYWKPPATPELDALLRKASGVIHVGANKGQEAALYDGYNLPVVWVEADPRTCEILRERIRDFPRQTAIAALVTDISGREYAFHVANNGGQSSSMLKPQLHKEMWPDVEFTTVIPLTSSTLDEVMAGLPSPGPRHDVLVMDAQGAELLVLRGGEKSLKQIRAIKTEASDFEAYEGCCTVAMLDSWLGERGFKKSYTAPGESKSGVGSFYELYYERIDHLAA